MYAVEAAGVSRRFGRRVAVEGLTLQINPGEIVGFLGRNGAGKTTTLRMLAGLLHPDEGTVRVFGYDTQARGFAAHGLVGVLPEDAAIRVMGTAWENLLQAAESRYVRPEEARRRAGSSSRCSGSTTGRRAGARVLKGHETAACDCHERHQRPASAGA